MPESDIHEDGRRWQSTSGQSMTPTALRHACELLGFSVSDMAGAIGQDRATVFRYANGELLIPLRTALAIECLLWRAGLLPVGAAPPVDTGDGPERLIVREVAAQHGVAPHSLYGPSQDRTVAKARRHAMARIRDELGWSLPRIGRLFARDHTTVLHHIRRWEEARP